MWENYFRDKIVYYYHIKAHGKNNFLIRSVSPYVEIIVEDYSFMFLCEKCFTIQSFDPSKNYLFSSSRYKARLLKYQVSQEESQNFNILKKDLYPIHCTLNNEGFV